MEKNKVGWIFSWPMITIMVFIFWPVSILLLIGRIRRDKAAILTVAYLIRIAGWGLVGFSLLGIVVLFTEGFGDVMLCFLLFGVPGIILIVMANQIQKKSDKMKRYIAIVINGQEYMLENIAAATQLSYDMVKKDLQEMIDKGYFTGAYINATTKELVFKHQPVEMIQGATAQPPKPQQPGRQSQCSCCGANNMIVGDVGECEFCGSKLA